MLCRATRAFAARATQVLPLSPNHQRGVSAETSAYEDSDAILALQRQQRAKSVHGGG